MECEALGVVDLAGGFVAGGDGAFGAEFLLEDFFDGDGDVVGWAEVDGLCGAAGRVSCFGGFV